MDSLQTKESSVNILSLLPNQRAAPFVHRMGMARKRGLLVGLCPLLLVSSQGISSPVLCCALSAIAPDPSPLAKQAGAEIEKKKKCLKGIEK